MSAPAAAPMTSRAAQDVILRLLADGPFRAAALSGTDATGRDVAAVLARVDRGGLDRFGRFLCRHYYRERVVHYFRYSRALSPLTRRAPESVLKTAEFNALMPALTLGERKSARSVLDLLHRHLTRDADPIRASLPYWDDLVTYQSLFFLTDALPPERAVAPFPARAGTATVAEFGWDLPVVLPLLLRPFREAPPASRRSIRLLFARSPHGEVTAIRCTDALRDLLEALTGREDPAQVAARMRLESGAFDATLRRLEELGAVASPGPR